MSLSFSFSVSINVDSLYTLHKNGTFGDYWLKEMTGDKYVSSGNVESFLETNGDSTSSEFADKDFKTEDEIESKNDETDTVPHNVETSDNNFPSEEAPQSDVDQSVKLDNETGEDIYIGSNDDSSGVFSRGIGTQHSINDIKPHFQMPSSCCPTSNQISRGNVKTNSSPNLASFPLHALDSAPTTTTTATATVTIPVSTYDSTSDSSSRSSSVPSMNSKATKKLVPLPRKKKRFALSVKYPNKDDVYKNPSGYLDIESVKYKLDQAAASSSENEFPNTGMDTNPVPKEKFINPIKNASETMEKIENEPYVPVFNEHIYPVVTVIRKTAPPKPPRKKWAAKWDQKKIEVKPTEGTSVEITDKNEKNMDKECDMSQNNSQEKETSTSSTSETLDDSNGQNVPSKVTEDANDSSGFDDEDFKEEKINYTDEFIANKLTVMHLLEVDKELLQVNEGLLSDCIQSEFFLKTPKDVLKILKKDAKTFHNVVDDRDIYIERLKINLLYTGKLYDRITNKGVFVGTFNKFHLTSYDMVYDLYTTPGMDYITHAEKYVLVTPDVFEFVRNANYCLANPVSLPDFLNKQKKFLQQAGVEFNLFYKYAMKKSIFCFIDAILHYAVDNSDDYVEQIASLKRGVNVLKKKLRRKDRKIFTEVFKTYMEEIGYNVAVAQNNIQYRQRINQIFVEKYINNACEEFENTNNYFEALANVINMLKHQKMIVEGCFENVYFYQNVVKEMVMFVNRLKGHIQRNSILKTYHFDYLLENSRALEKLSNKNLTSVSVDEKYKSPSVLEFGLHIVRHFPLAQTIHDFFETKKVEIGVIATRVKAFISHIQRKSLSEKDPTSLYRSLNEMLKKATSKLHQIFEKMRKQYISVLKIRYAGYIKRNHLLFDSLF